MSKYLRIGDLDYVVSVNSGGTIKFDTGINNTGKVIVTGSFTVNGPTTAINSETLTIKDNIVVINYGQEGAGVTPDGGTAGIEIERGDLLNAQMLFHEDLDGDTVFNFQDKDEIPIAIGTNLIVTNGYDLTLIGKGTNIVTVEGTTDYEAQVLDYANVVALPVNDDIVPNIKSVTDYVGNYFSYTPPRSLNRGDSYIKVDDVSTWEEYKNYVVDDVVIDSGTYYQCVVPHTSTPILGTANPIYWTTTVDLNTLDGTITVVVDDSDPPVSQWTVDHFDVFDLRVENSTIKAIDDANDIKLVGQDRNNVVIIDTSDYVNRVINTTNTIALPNDDKIVPDIKTVVDYVGNYFSNTDPSRIKRDDTSIEMFDASVWEEYTFYVVDDIVADNGSFFQCILPHASVASITTDNTEYWTEITQPLNLNTIDVTVANDVVSRWTTEYFDVFDLRVENSTIKAIDDVNDIKLIGQDKNNVVKIDTSNYIDRVLDFANVIALPVDSDIVPSIGTVTEYVGNYYSYTTPFTMERGNTSVTVNGVEEWQTYKNYIVGDKIIYQDDFYVCTHAHTSLGLLSFDAGSWQGVLSLDQAGSVDVTIEGIVPPVSTWTASYFNVFDLRVENSTIKVIDDSNDIKLIGQDRINVVKFDTPDYVARVINTDNVIALPTDPDIVPSIETVVDYVGNYYSYIDPARIKRANTAVEVFDASTWTEYSFYIVNDIVVDNGSYYQCVLPHASTSELTTANIEYWTPIAPPAKLQLIDVTVNDTLVSEWTETYFDVFDLEISENIIRSKTGTDDIILHGEGTNIVTVLGTTDYENQVITTANIVALPIDDDIIPNIKAVTDYVGNYFSYTTPRELIRGDSYIKVNDVSTWELYKNYIIDDVVIDNGTYYQCIKPHTSVPDVPTANAEYWTTTNVSLSTLDGTITVVVDASDPPVSTWTVDHFDVFDLRVENSTIKVIDNANDIKLVGQDRTGVVSIDTLDYVDRVINTDNVIALPNDDTIVPDIKTVVDYVGNYFSNTDPARIKRDNTSIEVFDVSDWSAYSFYVANDIVLNEGTYYQCILPHASLATFNAEFWTVVTQYELDTIKVTVNDALVSEWTETYFDVFDLEITENIIRSKSGTDDIILHGEGTNVVTVTGTTDYEDQVITTANVVALPIDDDIIPNIKAVTDYVGNYFSYTTPREISRGNSYIKVIDVGGWEAYKNYIIDDVVVSNGTYYQCILPHTSTNAITTTNPIYWTTTEVELDSITGRISVVVDASDPPVSEWTSTKFTVFGLKVANTTVSTINTDDELILKVSGTGSVTIDSYLKIIETETIPAQPTDGTGIYSQVPQAGGTGIFYVNNNDRFDSNTETSEPIRDELVSKRKAIAYSFIF